MMLSRRQLNAAVFASHERSRPALTYMAIDPDGTVYATNGVMLVQVTRTEASRDPSDYPAAALGFPDDAKPPMTTIYIPREIALEVAKHIPRRTNHPILRNVYVAATEQTLFLGTTDLEHPARITHTVRLDFSRKFPNCAAVIPSAGNAGGAKPVELSAVNLATVCQYRAQFAHGRKDLQPMQMTIGQNLETPIRIDWATDDYTVVVLVMTIRPAQHVRAADSREYTASSSEDRCVPARP